MAYLTLRIVIISPWTDKRAVAIGIGWKVWWAVPSRDMLSNDAAVTGIVLPLLLRRA